MYALFLNDEIQSPIPSWQSTQLSHFLHGDLPIIINTPEQNNCLLFLKDIEGILKTGKLSGFLKSGSFFPLSGWGNNYTSTDIVIQKDYLGWNCIKPSNGKKLISLTNFLFDNFSPYCALERNGVSAIQLRSRQVQTTDFLTLSHHGRMHIIPLQNQLDNNGHFSKEFTLLYIEKIKKGILIYLEQDYYGDLWGTEPPVAVYFLGYDSNNLIHLESVSYEEFQQRHPYVFLDVYDSEKIIDTVNLNNLKLTFTSHFTYQNIDFYVGYVCWNNSKKTQSYSLIIPNSWHVKSFLEKYSNTVEEMMRIPKKNPRFCFLPHYELRTDY